MQLSKICARLEIMLSKMNQGMVHMYSHTVPEMLELLGSCKEKYNNFKIFFLDNIRIF